MHHLHDNNLNVTYLNKSFFFRTYTIWNSLPFEIREIASSSVFKKEVVKHIWKLLLMDITEEDNWLTEDVSLSDND